MPEGRKRSGSREKQRNDFRERKRRTNKPKEAVKKEKAKFGLGREAEAFRGPLEGAGRAERKIKTREFDPGSG